MKPNSFSTICTRKYKEELYCLLLTLSIHHPNTKIYILCDKEIKQYINSIEPKPRLIIKLYPTLNRFSLISKKDMIKMGIWCDFQLMKIDIMKHAIEKSEDTLYLDCDNVILDTFSDIDKSKKIGLSRQYLNIEKTNEIGEFNGGLVWCNDKQILDKWIEYTKISRYFDQAALEDIYENFEKDCFIFQDNYNIQDLRFLFPSGTEADVCLQFSVERKKLLFNKKPIKNIHMRFLEKSTTINNFILLKLREAKLYKEIVCIFRCINKKWLIHIPKQPVKDKLYLHSNDGFRQLVFLIKLNNNDVDICYNTETYHCWLHPDILFYDRSSFLWVNNEFATSSLILLGNCNKQHYTKELEHIGLGSQDWYFWPQYPMLIEKHLKKYNSKMYKNRLNNIIYFGALSDISNYNKKWDKIITNHIPKFESKKSIQQICDSKYGLCINKYRLKSYRMMEMMAFGTVPIININVIIDGLPNLQENVHYIRVVNAKQLEKKIKQINKEKWTTMSNACIEWYDKYIHSKNIWKNTINNILYN
jgi:hypothetical protein